MTVTNLTPPVITGIAQQGQTLTTTTGTWDYDLDYLTYEYQWLRCDAAGANCVEISGATDYQRVLSAGDVGFRLRSEITATEHSQPPAGGGDLLWTPPGYVSGDPTTAAAFPGYTSVNAPTTSGTLTLDNNTDYYVNLGTLAWSSHPTDDSTGLQINGGRNVVIVGGEIIYTATNAQDDGRAIFIEGGNPAGTVYFEGLRITAPNGITRRSQRTLMVQNCRFYCTTYLDAVNTSVHSDVIQIWRQSSGISGSTWGPVRMSHSSALSNYTFLSDFTDLNSPYNGDQQPSYWELHDCDFHPINNTIRLASGNNWMGHPKGTWIGSNIWWQNSLDMAGGQRGLGDSLRQYGSQYGAYVPTIGGISGAQYLLYDASNNLLFTSPFPGYANPGGTAGRGQGHYLRYVDRVEHQNMDGIEWRAGLAPMAAGADASGYFAPNSVVGPSYVSPGYA